MQLDGFARHRQFAERIIAIAGGQHRHQRRIERAFRVLTQIVPNQRRDKVPFDQIQKAPAVEPVGKLPLGRHVGCAHTGTAAGEEQRILPVFADVVEIEAHG